MNRVRVPACLLAAGALLAGTAACSGDDPKPSQTSSGTSATTPAPTTAALRPAVAAVDPLNGGTPSANGVVAVKIDDTGNGRPQRNINQADVVYVEEVEGGLTRLAAVFHTALPTVASVRSTRPADPELLTQYGDIVYVASGGARVPLKILDKSKLKADINDRGGPGFARTYDKPAPYNLSADLKTIARTLKAPKAKAVGFNWVTPATAAVANAQYAAGTAGQKVRTMVGGTPVEFRYDTATRRYTRYIDGVAQRTAAGKLITTPNVLVQLCDVEPYPGDTDVNGNPNQYTHTVGSGSVVLFRGGKRVEGAWRRATEAAGTTLTTKTGQPLFFTPGGVWDVLTKQGTRVNS